MPRQRSPQRGPAPEPAQGFIAVAYVQAAHGARGELKVAPLTDFPDRFRPGAAVWAAGERRTIAGVRPYRDTLLVALEGIESRPAADALRGTLLEVPERELASLDEGEYYRFQIVGLGVFDREGHALGRVVEVLETGANDVYIVRDDEGELLVPAIDSVVLEVDLPGRRMVVELLQGMERRPVRPRPR